MLPIVSYADRREHLQAILSRSASFGADVEAAVEKILRNVRRRGDEALYDLTRRFDDVEVEELIVPSPTLKQAYDGLDEELRVIIAEAAENIRRYHEHQTRESWFVEDGDGVVLGQRVVPIERVGLYVPGGTAAYPSTVLMNAIPAQVAGVDEIVLVSPPGPDGRPHETILASAHLLGLDTVYAVGGAQAIAALAFGTETVDSVDKIVGPGNAYVAAAKRTVYGRVDIESVAGPSEIVVCADETADPEFVALDLLSQAEHDERSSAVLVTPERPLAEAVRTYVREIVPDLDRSEILRKSLTDYSACVITDSMAEAVQMVNELAPEHLELLVDDPWQMMTEIKHAGAIFMGPYSSEPVGDYYAGPNHVLPTGGTARYASALGVHDFIRRQSIISYTADRLEKTGSRIERFAREERLPAHGLAIRKRLERIDSGTEPD
jgi:histidinol dehydrogenase